MLSKRTKDNCQIWANLTHFKSFRGQTGGGGRKIFFGGMPHAPCVAATCINAKYTRIHGVLKIVSAIVELCVLYNQMQLRRHEADI